MKCPECGFECLPDDVECLACGIDIASAKDNKEKERIRSLEAAERKEKYDLEFKKELGLISDEEENQLSNRNGASLEDTFKKNPSCPKCGAERHPDAVECLRCGVIFEKMNIHVNGVHTQIPTKPVPVEATSSPVAHAFKSQPAIHTDVSDGNGVIRPEDKTDEIDLADLKMMGHDEIEPEKTEEPEKREEPEKTEQPEELVLEMESSAGPNGAESPSDRMVKDVPAALGGEAVQSQRFSFQGAPTISDDRSMAETLTLQPESPDRPEIPGANEQTEIIDLKTFSPRIRPISGGVSGYNVFRKKCKAAFEKASAWSHVVLVRGKAKVDQLALNKRKSIKVFSILAIAIVLALSTPFVISYYKNAKIERLQREHSEKLESIRVDFLNNKDEITRKIKLIISNRLFESAEKEIALYDIPSLQDELVPLNNYLKEIRMFEKAKTIPAVEFEQNYNAFSDLLKLNPDSQLYQAKKEFYRQKLANSEYSLAAAYAQGKNKNITDLDKALAAVNKALELYPDSKNFIKLKKNLLTENLLYYKGNGNIVMAVRDDGMGKKLYSGQRRMTLWLKNISQDTVYINVQFFTMIGKDKKRYTYNDIGRRFKTKLMPGEETRGELYFRTRALPSKIVFSHLISGEIHRSFP
ncbi:MAG: DUF4352 domain-containing protein [Proteobacteria bacterium]|nr:DUF4352 domain-containing protein [Pseudomonadota bacterium]